MLKTFHVNSEKCSAMNNTEDKKRYSKNVAMIITDKITKKDDIFSNLLNGSFSSVVVCLVIHSVGVSCNVSRETLSESIL